MGRFLVALAVASATALSTPHADAVPSGHWQVQPCPAGQKALWLPRVDGIGTDISCTTEEARNESVKAAAESGSGARLLNAAIAGAQQLADQSVKAEEPCVVGAKAAIGDALGTCVGG
ncbi:hypothetical protein [Nocardia sp. NRRL S-836]|uniref:hypothetical protein n=1 Tax=Nocardia sp. NRRL S-836 TaxID=1519492 RepID=UPI0006AF1EDC|nr:hypothetical protein [Nocardia sp. NRRL S-836]KOV79861.1 hypothetical protein ADL03_35380 [Nocardia sp. NRRL S-836]